ncbi:hypothetical protein BDV12DRAFT_162348 [Aspergillus spectabilis]
MTRINANHESNAGWVPSRRPNECLSYRLASRDDTANGAWFEESTKIVKRRWQRTPFPLLIFASLVLVKLRIRTHLLDAETKSITFVPLSRLAF